jgi:proline iminopeptidase
VFAKVNGINLYFDVDGYGLRFGPEGLVPKPVLLVLHGGPGLDHSDLVPWLAPLTDDMQLVYVDHRGNGRSERLAVDKCTPEHMADDLEALRGALGIRRWSVLGFSFGGTVALHYALRYPMALDKLIVCSTPTSYTFIEEARSFAAEAAGPDALGIVEELLDGRLLDDKEAGARLARLRPLYFHDYVAERDASRRGTILNVGLSNWYFASYARNYDLRPALAAVRAPTLVMVGRHDWICSMKQSEPLVSLVPDVRRVVFEGSGHVPMKEEHEQFISSVRSFCVTEHLSNSLGGSKGQA